jgi:hypothetical protein
MKKRQKKLALYRETVLNLDPSRLQGVAGGTGYTHNENLCGTTCRCLDFPDTFSADCTPGCPATSLG